VSAKERSQAANKKLAEIEEVEPESIFAKKGTTAKPRKKKVDTDKEELFKGQ